MIDTIAKRAFNLNGSDYAEGAKVPMPLQQFQDLEPTGLVERAPKPSKPKATAPARTRTKAAEPAAVPPAPTESQSPDMAD